ncbi:phage regulatory protein/antirepressor Ant [Clostridium paraputrificum]|uniref:phage regulatory protein/antirepressor Ant n=1 Tax=Clostridium paraputrificum TaxID=29363 RepID=UPI00066763D2|nr:phage regulatory protein/antirepressor Ant [Clostridium paraputrificum]MDB2105974.1 phage regulatory protein/antirepressor Ant [Clostridium paraputrificum]MDB2114304.1 phage regulatory protein/antirepressor Ant [Clostridium paraputrificum]
MENLINVTNYNGTIVVSSRDVARDFGKEHNDTKKRIRELVRDMGEISHNYFVPSEYKDSLNRTQEEYLLTRDGFSLLVMGFTGAPPLKWKLKYIDAFNKMEQALRNQVPQLSEKQQCILAIYDGGQGAIQGAKRLSEIEIAEAVAPLEAKIEEQKPLVTFAEQVGDSCDLISVRELAKLANDENLDIGEKRLFQWLRENGYLSDKKVNGNFTNEPYQRFVKQGLFKVIEQTYTTPFGIRLSKKIMITGKGQIYFINKLKYDGRFEHGFGEMLLSS